MGAELTIFERSGTRTYPIRVRDPRDWASALDTAEHTTDPANLSGLLEWDCSRCGTRCDATLVTLHPIRFTPPAAHWCRPTGLRRLTALMKGTGTDPHPTTPPLPALPLTYP